MNKTLTLAAASFAIATGAQAQDLSITTDLTFATEYVFRGIQLADHTFMPSIEASYGDLTAGIWAALPTENRSSAGYIDEYDFYAGYTAAVSETVSLDIGGTYYFYPEADSTLEGYLGVNFDLEGFTPGIYAYYDFDLEAFTLQGSVGYSIPVEALGSTVDLGATVGRVDPDGGEDYLYYGFDVSVPYSINENTTVTAGLHWASHDLEGVEDNHLWVTVGLSMGF